MIEYIDARQVAALWIAISEGRDGFESEEMQQGGMLACQRMLEETKRYGAGDPHPWASEMARRAGRRTSRKKRLAAKENGFDKGSQNQNSRLDESKVKQIRRLGKSGKQHVRVRKVDLAMGHFFQDRCDSKISALFVIQQTSEN